VLENMTRATLAISMLCLMIASATANIYRCIPASISPEASNAQKAPLFSQFPCPSGDDVQSIVVTDVSVVEAPKLTTSEQATLKRIQQRFHSDRASAAKQQLRARRRSNDKRTERAALCTQTRQALKELRKRKRGGYSLATAKSLATQEAQLKTRASANC
jgi:hypothetical protein